MITVLYDGFLSDLHAQVFTYTILPVGEVLAETAMTSNSKEEEKQLEELENIKQKNEIIKQKDDLLKQKNEIIKQQNDIIEQQKRSINELEAKLARIKEKKKIKQLEAEKDSAKRLQRKVSSDDESSLKLVAGAVATIKDQEKKMSNMEMQQYQAPRKEPQDNKQVNLLQKQVDEMPRKIEERVVKLFQNVILQAPLSPIRNIQATPAQQTFTVPAPQWNPQVQQRPASVQQIGYSCNCVKTKCASGNCGCRKRGISCGGSCSCGYECRN